MPAQQEPNQAGFPSSRRAYDGDVFSGADGQVDIAKHVMARGHDTDIFERDDGCRCGLD